MMKRERPDELNAKLKMAYEGKWIPPKGHASES